MVFETKIVDAVVKYLKDPFKEITNIALFLAIAVIVIIIVVWYFANQNRSYTIQNNPDTNSGVVNSSSNTNSNSNYFNYQKANLGQISNFSTSNSSSENISLPASFSNIECAPGLVPIQNIIDNVSICLADFDSPCRTVSDCRPEAIGCINNVCSLLSNINQPCIADTDCWYFNGKRINNYNCIAGYCKVPTFPQSAGCNYDSDCDTSGILNNVICLKNESQTYLQNFQSSLILFNITNISGVLYFTSESTVNHNFWNIGTQILLFDTTDTTSITESTLSDGFAFGNAFYTGIISGTTSDSFSVSDLNSGELPSGALNISTFPSSSGLVAFGGYLSTDNAILAGYVGVCVEKLPLGAPSNLQIGGFTIPCQDQYISRDNRCVQPGWTGSLGQICLNDSTDLQCLQNNNNTLDSTIGCAYNYQLTNIALDSFLYNYDPTSYDIYQLGTCSYEIMPLANDCNLPSKGCSRPYICLPSLATESGTICTQPLDVMYCDQGYLCPNGYKCDVVNNVPICKSLENSICFSNQDCFNGNCDSSNMYLNMYSMDLRKFVNIAVLDNFSSGVSGVVLSQDYSTVQNFNGITGKQTKMPNRFIVYNTDNTTDNTNIYIYNLNTTTNKYDFYTSIDYYHPTADTYIDVQVLFTPGNDIAIFTGTINLITPEIGYKISSVENNNNSLQININGYYHMFNSEYSSNCTYYAYVYYENGNINQQDNFVFQLTLIDSVYDAFLTNISYSDYSANTNNNFTNLINNVNNCFLMISVLSFINININMNQMYKHQDTFNDNLFHVPLVYKFDSIDVNNRQLIYCPLFNTGDEITDTNGNVYYLEELYQDVDNVNTYIFNLHSDYFAAEGDVMTKLNGGLRQKVYNITDLGLDLTNLNFSVNVNTKSYSMINLDTDTLTPNVINYILTSNTTVFNHASVNGINGSISYVFDKNINVSISMEANNNNNYIYFKTDIPQQNSVFDEIVNSYVQKVQYVLIVGDTYSASYQNNYKFNWSLNGSDITTAMNFKYLNSFAIPRTKTTPNNKAFVADVEETFFDNQADTIQIMSTLKNCNQSVSYSRLNELEPAESDGSLGINFDNYNIFEKQQYEPFLINNNISLDSSSSGNRINDDGITITFTDVDVIETILSFPASEIVLIKNGDTLQDYYISGNGTSSINTKLTDTIYANTNTTFTFPAPSQYSNVRTEIARSLTVVSYDDDTDELIVKMNAPVDVNDNYVKNVFNSTNKAKLWLYNFAPISFISGENRWFNAIFTEGQNVSLETNSATGEINNITILDSSLIFGATKSDFNTFQTNMSRSSFNKLTLYDGNIYTSYLVHDNYFLAVDNAFDNTIPVFNSFYSSNRKHETIFTSDNLTQYEKPNSTTQIKDSKTYSNNNQIIANSFTINSNINILSSIDTMHNTFDNGENSFPYNTYANINDNEVDYNDTIINATLALDANYSREDYLNNFVIDFSNSSTSKTNNLKFSPFRSKIFYTTGRIGLTQTGLTLPSKIPIFEISSNIIHATNIIDTGLNEQYIDDAYGNGLYRLQPYRPNRVAYETYTNSNTNNNFCYFKRKYLVPRLFDSALSLSNLGDHNLTNSVVNDYEVFAIGNNENLDNYLITALRLNVFLDNNIAFLTEYGFIQNSNSYINQNDLNVNGYTKQPLESFITSKNLLPEITYDSQNASLLAFEINTLLNGNGIFKSMEYDTFSKTYYDCDGFLIVKYTNNLPTTAPEPAWYGHAYQIAGDVNTTNTLRTAVQNYYSDNTDTKHYRIDIYPESNNGVIIYLEIRPVYSSTINIPLTGIATTGIAQTYTDISYPSKKLYIVNNMFLTSIERPLSSNNDLRTKFYYNTRKSVNNVFIINSFKSSGKTVYRMTGQINFPINTAPVVIGSNTNYNLSNSSIINFPTNFTERFVSAEFDSFVIDHIFSSYKFGNNFSRMRYYVVGHYDDSESATSNYQLLYLANASEKMLTATDTGIPTSLTFLNNANTLNLENNIVYEPFNNVILLLSSQCLS